MQKSLNEKLWENFEPKYEFFKGKFLKILEKNLEQIQPMRKKSPWGGITDTESE